MMALTAVCFASLFSQQRDDKAFCLSAELAKGDAVQRTSVQPVRLVSFAVLLSHSLTLLYQINSTRNCPVRDM